MHGLIVRADQEHRGDGRLACAAAERLVAGKAGRLARPPEQALVKTLHIRLVRVRADGERAVDENHRLCARDELHRGARTRHGAEPEGAEISRRDPVRRRGQLEQAHRCRRGWSAAHRAGRGDLLRAGAQRPARCRRPRSRPIRSRAADGGAMGQERHGCTAGAQ